jgi:hypothetical protein
VADIRNSSEPDQVELTLTLEELRVMVHRLAPRGSFLRKRAEAFLPEGHRKMADDLSEKLRRFHDRGMNRSDG